MLIALRNSLRPRPAGPAPGARRALGRLRRDCRGQALVEFALVVPLVIMIIFFAIWFTEALQIKLKVQEVGRYLAWEATSYKLHDYDSGKAKSVSSVAGSITSEAGQRYADLDSSTKSPTPSHVFSAAFTAPMMMVTGAREKIIPSGSFGNFIAGIVGALGAVVYALAFKSQNHVATALVAVGKGKAGTGASVAFGDSSWGFNQNGYVTATVSTLVTNLWAYRGVGKMVMEGNSWPFFMEQYKLLVDDWALSYGGNAYTDNGVRPGVSQNAYWKQVDRMYLMNSKGRNTLKGFITQLLAQARIALGQHIAIPPQQFNETKDFVQTALASRNYGPDQTSKARKGQVTLNQDRGSTRSYDTAPVCENCSGSQELKKYGETLKDRGEYFMGCKGPMKMGCTSTTSQDNPFGDYLVR